MNDVTCIPHPDGESILIFLDDHNAISSAVTATFLSGSCLEMATALSELTGWPVVDVFVTMPVGVIYYNGEFDLAPFTHEMLHSVVMHPQERRPVDVTGLYSPERHWRKPSRSELREHTRHFKRRTVLPHSLQVARHYAPMVLELTQEGHMERVLKALLWSHEIASKAKLGGIYVHLEAAPASLLLGGAR